MTCANCKFCKDRTHWLCYVGQYVEVIGNGKKLWPWITPDSTCTRFQPADPPNK